ncbi:hypothetical protein ACP275_06G049800 [Erythranthe tilingii]
MDPDPPKAAPRKVRFAPKEPRRRTPKPSSFKIEPAPEVDDTEDLEAQEFLNRKVKEHLARRGRPKSENKGRVQVAFSNDVGSSSIRTFGRQKESSDVAHDAVDSKELTPNGVQNLVTSMSITGLTNGVTVTKKKKREYKEPWDYENSYYPTTLPLRRPYSGNPELLDNSEFEDAVECDEDSLSSALDLGLLDEDDNTPKMLFFQFPSNLPTGKRAASKGKEIAGTNSRILATSINPPKQGSRLEELPDGYMGKMLVYKSGAVKLKLGSVLYDVSPGSDCMFSQSVVAVNTTDGSCCEVGEVNKRAIVTPDIGSLLVDNNNNNVIDLG